jgi:hypothetical protein
MSPTSVGTDGSSVLASALKKSQRAAFVVPLLNFCQGIHWIKEELVARAAPSPLLPQWNHMKKRLLYNLPS